MTSIHERLNLGGRTALVVGGAGHIGAAIAESLAEIGAAVAIADLAGSPNTDVASRLSEAHRVEGRAFDVDLTDDTSTARLPGRVVEELGGLDVVVHAAALVGSSSLAGWTVPLAEQSVETWRKAMEVNLTSAFVLAQAAEAPLRLSGHASIILISSIHGLVGVDPTLYEGTSMAVPAAYSASKGGMIQLTRWLATTLAPDIRVNALCPGGVARGQAESFVTRYIARTPLDRMAREEDLQGAAAFLASDLSAYVTGQTLVVDGGYTIR